MFIKKIFRKAFKQGLNEILLRASQQNYNKFLVLWNRGLGDIALGLYPFIYRVREYIPSAQISFVTRSDLREGFLLLEDIEIIVLSDLKRGDKITLSDLKKRLSSEYDVILLNDVDPRGELKDYHGKLTPRLKWKEEYDGFFERFKIDRSKIYIGAHISTETQQFYGYRKDWPLEKWRELFGVICKEDVQVILFGLKKDNSFENNPFVIDLRGETGLLEVLSIIKNCCKALIAPDGGILSIAYYLDVNFPITVISLWGDSHQGVLKQAVPSPNPGLLHVPLIGKNSDVTEISVEEVVEALNADMNVQSSGGLEKGL